ncbi:MAG: nitroreductase family protein [Desulfobacterota bacterium]|nr:nitroreductase family protein [Thermodesulfobacteriota bacterium]
MNLESLERLLKARRSVRRWRAEEVPDELLRKAVELATWAPNGGNYQGWYFVIVKNRAVIRAMADAVQSAVDTVASWPEARSWDEEVRRYRANASFFRDAPAVVGLFVREYRSVMDKVLIEREAHDPVARRIMGFRRTAPTAIQSAASAATLMLLAFHQMGLGAVWLASPLMAKEEIERILQVPSEMGLVCLIAVGYPDESPQKERRPVEEVMRFVV